MRFSLSIVFCAIALIWIGNATTLCAQAAIVNTTHGTCEGRVIVRESTDRLVVTILAQDKRLFQFYARDIVSVTATEKVLIGKSAPLRSQPNEEVFPLLVFPRGVEVKIIEDNPDLEWVKVQAGANIEGWIQRDCLTDQVVYTPEEKAIPLQKPSVENSTQESPTPDTAAVPVPATETEQ